MYLPKNKYRILNAVEGELVTLDGDSFSGPYIKVSSGKFFAGDSLENAGQELVLPSTFENTVEIEIPFNDYIGPTPEDYQKGFFTRYILQNTRTEVIKEVNKKRFIKFSKLENTRAVSIRWDLSKPVEDIKKDNYIYEGSRSKNRKLIQNLENRIPGISNFLDPSDYLN